MSPTQDQKIKNIIILEPEKIQSNNFVEATDNLESSNEYHVDSCDDPNEVIQLVQLYSATIIIAGIIDKDDIKKIILVCEKIKTFIKSNFCKVMVYVSNDNQKIEKLLRQKGVSEFLNENITSKSLLYKFNLIFKTLHENIVEDVEEENVEQRFSQDIDIKNKISFKDPINKPFELWSILNKDSFSYFQNRWNIEATGPPKHMGEWNEFKDDNLIYDTEENFTSFRWCFNKDSNEFVTKGHWIFLGEKPIYTNINNKWTFSAINPVLVHLDSEQNTSYKINSTKKQIIVANDSPTLKEILIQFNQISAASDSVINEIENLSEQEEDLTKNRPKTNKQNIDTHYKSQAMLKGKIQSDKIKNEAYLKEESKSSYYKGSIKNQENTIKNHLKSNESKASIFCNNEENSELTGISKVENLNDSKIKSKEINPKLKELSKENDTFNNILENKTDTNEHLTDVLTNSINDDKIFNENSPDNNLSGTLSSKTNNSSTDKFKEQSGQINQNISEQEKKQDKQQADELEKLKTTDETVGKGEETKDSELKGNVEEVSDISSNLSNANNSNFEDNLSNLQVNSSKVDQLSNFLSSDHIQKKLEEDFLHSLGGSKKDMQVLSNFLSNPALRAKIQTDKNELNNDKNNLLPLSPDELEDIINDPDKKHHLLDALIESTSLSNGNQADRLQSFLMNKELREHLYKENEQNNSAIKSIGISSKLIQKFMMNPELKNKLFKEIESAGIVNNNFKAEEIEKYLMNPELKNKLYDEKDSNLTGKGNKTEIINTHLLSKKIKGQTNNISEKKQSEELEIDAYWNTDNIKQTNAQNISEEESFYSKETKTNEAKDDSYLDSIKKKLKELKDEQRKTTSKARNKEINLEIEKIEKELQAYVEDNKEKKKKTMQDVSDFYNDIGKINRPSRTTPDYEFENFKKEQKSIWDGIEELSKNAKTDQDFENIEQQKKKAKFDYDYFMEKLNKNEIEIDMSMDQDAQNGYLMDSNLDAPKIDLDTITANIEIFCMISYNEEEFKFVAEFIDICDNLMILRHNQQEIAQEMPWTIDIKLKYLRKIYNLRFQGEIIKIHPTINNQTEIVINLSSESLLELDKLDKIFKERQGNIQTFNYLAKGY